MKRTLAIFPILLLLALASSGCDPNYDREDHDGHQPRTEPNWVVIDHVDEIAPDKEPILCGETRSVHLSLTQTVASCSPYNFHSLYLRAKTLVDARAAQVVCPEGCTIRQAYYTHWSWSCAGTSAKVEVKAKVRCLNAPGALPANVGDGSNLNMTAAAVTNAAGESGPVVPPPPIAAPTKGEILVIEAATPPTAPLVLCGQKVLISFTYRQNTATGGAPIQGYEPYVDMAKARALLLHATFICENPCVKQPFRPLYTSWALVGTNTVVVRVFFEVECKRP